MTITPDQARELLDGATPGPWDASFDDEADATRLYAWGEDEEIEDGDSWELARLAPDLAQTIAEMTEKWSVEKHDGHRWLRHGGWVGLESIARLRLRKAREDGETARLTRRLFGPVEVAE